MTEKLKDAVKLIFDRKTTYLENEFRTVKIEMREEILTELTKNEMKGKVFDKVNVETPFTIEDLAETTDETFIKKTIPYAKEWFREKLCSLRYDFKEAIRDHDKKLGDPIVHGE